jgi:radical SAM protein with 4Fe4S-binding SPASM domain
MTPKDESERNSMLSVFREQMLLIAKKEIEFYKKNGRHLCTWFAGDDAKINCSAGLNMIAVDVDGGTYACHGALYSPGKEEMKSATIFDDDFVEKVSKFNDKFLPSVTNINPVCESCVATTCMICPVASYELSKEESFFSKWGDRQINGICSFYQTFGKIDRTVQHHLNTTKILEAV